MDQPDREVEPFFTQPVRQFAVMALVLVLAGSVGKVAYPRVAEIFWANPYLNGFIFFVFVIGVLACFWQVLQLVSSVSWIEGFAGGRPGHTMVKAPRLLAPLAALLRSRGAKMQIGASSSRSILDSVATRIDEARDITRYIVNLLIFLGLLGTFYGLATTVPAVVETIRSLAPKEGEGSVEIFSRLMTGLEAQLSGMGVAFSSSLLGLAGSLIVGLLELFAGHGQNRFYRELEEWLSTITRLGFSSGDGDSDGVSQNSGGAEFAGHISEQMEVLQTLYTQSDVSRSLVDKRLGKLADSVEALTNKLDGGGQTVSALNRLADGQDRMIALMADRDEEGAGNVDAESRMRLRSIDVQLLRILEEMSAGRQESLTDLRTDLGALTNAVRQMAKDPTSSGGRRG